VSDVLQQIWNTIVNGISSIAQAIWGGIQWIADRVAGIVSMFQNFWNAVANAILNAASMIWDGIRWIAGSIWNGLVFIGQLMWNVILSITSPIFSTVQDAVTNAISWVSQNVASKIIDAYNYIASNIGSVINWFASVLFPGIGAGEVKFARAMTRSVATYLGLKMFRRGLESFMDSLVGGKDSLARAGLGMLAGALIPYIVPMLLEPVLIGTYTYAKPNVPQPSLVPYQYTPVQAPYTPPPEVSLPSTVDIKISESFNVNALALLNAPVPLSGSESAGIDAAASAEIPNARTASESSSIDASVSVVKSLNQYAVESSSIDADAGVVRS